MVNQELEDLVKEKTDKQLLVNWRTKLSIG